LALPTKEKPVLPGLLTSTQEGSWLLIWPVSHPTLLTTPVFPTSMFEPHLHHFLSVELRLSAFALHFFLLFLFHFNKLKVSEKRKATKNKIINIRNSTI
jgi:hypothetical protein